MKFACRWDCGHFCCASCAFRSTERNRCHICRTEGQGLAVEFVPPLFRIDPDSTVVDYAYLLEKATQVPALQQAAKLLLELAKDEGQRWSGSTGDHEMAEVVNNSG